MSSVGAPAGFRNSLRFRMAAAIVSVLALGSLAVAIAAFAYGRNAAQQSFDRLLIGAANQVAGSLSLRGGDIIVDIPVSAFELLSLAPKDRVVYGVFGPDGALITGYAEAAPPTGSGAFYSGEFANEPARFARVTRQFAERSFIGSVDVVIGQTTEARRELAQQITRNALVAVAVVGLVVSGLAVLAVQSALSPLQRIESDFAARSSKDLTPVDIDVPQEIKSLVGALNTFIARIDRQLNVMQSLIADASHQLRTPIAALRAQAELAADETDPDRQRGIVTRIHERSRNLSHLTDQLLNHAMIIHRADAIDLKAIDLRSVAAQAVHEVDLAITTSDNSLRLELPEAPVTCLGDPLSLQEAVKNLVSNALKHGEPPITIFVREDTHGPAIGVRDRGQGIPEAMWEDAAERFAKNAGVSAKSAGLGLAIVSEVARAHGGAMQFARPTPGRFEVALALSPVPVGIGG